MENFPEIVTFRITSQCNNNCAYCLGPKNIPGLKFSTLQKIFKIFSQKGVKAMILTGGEPLLHGRIDKILKILAKLKIKIFLDTNAEFFFKHKKYINRYVASLGLPIDSVSKFPSYRNETNLQKVKSILEYYQNRQKRFQIRIGTVATQDNLNNLASIARFLQNYNIDVWKIHQFIPIGENASKNRLRLEISEEDFNKKTQALLKKFSSKINIVISKRKSRADAYFLLNPDGSVIMPHDDSKICRNEKLGHILDENILEKWQKAVHERKYIDNAEPTFNLKCQSLPMELVYNRIWQLAKNYYQRGQFYNLDHIEWSIKEALVLAKKERLDFKILLPLIILHDIGYVRIPRANPFRQETRSTHMLMGSKIVQDILRKVNYSEELIKKIALYVSIHDRWAFGDHEIYKKDICLGVFNDIDYISMFSKGGFPAMMKLLKKDEENMLTYLKDNEKLVNRPFCTISAKKLYQEYLNERA